MGSAKDDGFLYCFGRLPNYTDVSSLKLIINMKISKVTSYV